MCGIFGAVSFSGKVNKDDVRRATDTIYHRGPDDSGIYVNPGENVSFGHRRLNIIDLSPAGHQPMTNEDNTVWITYNGEIYNYLSLREELIKAGHKFRSTSDTETIIHGYEEWGIGILDKLRGMFAFSIYDEKKNLVFCARDRFGIKPFNYYIDDNKFLFCSELKGIYSYRDIDKSINDSAIYDFFTYGYIPEPKTILKKAYKLPAGHYLLVSNGELTVKKYWDINFHNKIKINESEAVEELNRIIRNTVDVHKIADVPIGLFLSGGLDSSTIAYNLSKELSENFRCYSIGFDIADYDESKNIRIVRDSLGLNVRLETLTNDIAKTIIPIALNNFDECYADTSAIPTYFVAKTASEDIKVCMSGEGGDECFGGYEWYSKFFSTSEEFLRSNNDSRLKWFYSLSNRIYPYVRFKNFLIERNINSELEYYAYLLGATIRKEKGRIFTKSFLNNFNGYDDYWYFDKYYDSKLADFDRIQYLDIKTYLQNDLLPKIDISSMASSLESRVPFVDHVLMEFVASLPVEIRNKNNEKKYLLKKYLKGKLPEEIIYQKKWGFAVPLEKYVTHNSLPDKLHPYLEDKINFKKFHRYYHFRQIWQILSLNNTLNKITGSGA